MELAEEIRAEGRGKVREEEPLAKHTSFHIGGPARIWVEPEACVDLEALLGILAHHQIRWLVLGEGTNVLVSDRGFPGAVIRLGPGFGSLVFQGERAEVGAAVRMRDLVRAASGRALGGLGFAAGLPGTVGGACVTNAGIPEEAIGDRILEVEMMKAGEGKKEGRGEMEFSYRHSSLRGAGVILKATLELVPGEKEDIRKDLEARRNSRRKTQPLTLASAGSVFKNAPGASAGKLISDCGLRGVREGEAEISSVHANFIVNRGRASAGDVLGLIERAEQEVERRFGVSLEREIELLGFSGKDE